MRPMYVIGGGIVALALGGVLAWTRLAPAQAPTSSVPPVTETMTVMVNDVQVRSGPSTDFYPTGTLNQGDRVEVVGKAENPGWLKIKPPAGTVSWVNALAIKQTTPSTGVIEWANPEGVPVRSGSIRPDQDLNVIKTTATNGTQVVLRGKALTLGNYGLNIPIEPLASEVRYIPETVVSRSGVQPASAQAPGNGFVQPPPGTGPSLLAQADEAYQKARQLYMQAAQSTDPNEKSLAMSRLQNLAPVGAAGNGQPPGYPFATAAQGGGAPKVVLGTTVGLQGSAGTTAAYVPNGQPAAPKWSSWGKLQKTAIKLADGTPIYRIADDRGNFSYTVPGQGLTLEPYVGRTVSVYGPTPYGSGDYFRDNYTVASYLALPPGQ